MIFIPLLFIGILLYLSGKRIASSLIFFFFLTDGFQITPLALFDTGIGMSKSLDFAFLYIFLIFLYGVFFYENFINQNKISSIIKIFCAFIIISIIVNRYIYGVAWSEIIRTSRYFFFVLAYYIFRRLDLNDINQLLKILFYICLVQCCIYAIQSVVGIPLLTGESESKIGQFGELNRYYNIPILFYYFLFYAIFNNPFKLKRKKYFSISIFFIVAIVSMHRSLIAPVFILPILGVFLFEKSIKKTMQYILVSIICIIFFGEIILSRFQENTSSDIELVTSGGFIEYDNELSDGTFLFRVALFYERWDYIMEANVFRKIFGVGFMTEDSHQTNSLFDFKVGLTDDEQRVVQLDTSDIAWVNFILRLGFLGTLIYISLYCYFLFFFYKNKKEDYLHIIPFLYILLLLITSVSSSSLFHTWMIIPLFLNYITATEKNINNEENKCPNISIQL